LISRRSWAILPALVTRSTATANALLALILAAAGCATPCEELGKRICACLPAGTSRDACDRAARSAVAGVDKANAAQQEACDAMLSGPRACPDPNSDPGACEFMATCVGKVRCGLASGPEETVCVAP
jgi:hypothetical protein